MNGAPLMYNLNYFKAKVNKHLGILACRESSPFFKIIALCYAQMALLF